MDNLEIEEIIQRHEEQKRLFEYQNARVLARPKTKIIHVFFWVLIYFISIACCIILNIKISMEYYYEIPISIIVYIWISEFSLKRIGIKIVECYQHYGKEVTRRQCVCVPSCSEYAIGCFKKYCLIKALLKIRKRLFVTCKGPLFKIDPI